MKLSEAGLTPPALAWASHAASSHRRSARRSAAGPCESGFTVIEVLVVVAIVGILLALILPAISAARESARCALCQSNLKQIGIGLHAFESVNGHLPGFGYINPDTRRLDPKSLSPSGAIAAFLGSEELAIEMGRRMDVNGSRDDLGSLSSPAVLRCPSDPLARGEFSSYRYNRGVLPCFGLNPGGPFDWAHDWKTAKVTDGLSQTVFASERLIHDGKADHSLRRGVLKLPNSSDGSGLSDVSQCFSLNRDADAVPFGEAIGAPWYSPSYLHAAYYHLLPPNAIWLDCVRSSRMANGLISARSAHVEGVNTLMGDGAVRFISNSVDIVVWRALGTCAGNETESGQ